MQNSCQRIVIVGGPRTGKSTLARRLRERGWPTFCGDPRWMVKQPEPDVTYLPFIGDWTEMAEWIVDHWFPLPGPWVCESHIMALALRITLERESTLPDRVIVLTTPIPGATTLDGQRRMQKGVQTVWNTIAPQLKGITLTAPEAQAWIDDLSIDQIPAGPRTMGTDV